jgi:hypothetical protein
MVDDAERRSKLVSFSGRMTAGHGQGQKGCAQVGLCQLGIAIRRDLLIVCVNTPSYREFSCVDEDRLTLALGKHRDRFGHEVSLPGIGFALIAVKGVEERLDALPGMEVSIGQKTSSPSHRP